MKAKIISWTNGSVSETTYDVIQREKDNNKLIVGENNDGKPIINTYKDNEVLFIEDIKQIKNYYWIRYKMEAVGGYGYQVTKVIDVHPFEYFKIINALVDWKEISKDEYDLYNKLFGR